MIVSSIPAKTSKTYKFVNSRTLTEHRENAVAKVYIRGKATLDFLETYEKQLVNNKQSVQDNFVWYDAFDQKSRLCKCLTSQASDNRLEFELACVRWNIGSLLAYLACENITETQNETTLKAAYDDLRKAAGIFGALRVYIGKLQLDGLTQDLEDETLSALENYCLAAAQFTALIVATKKELKAKLAAGSNSLLNDVVEADIPRSLRHDISVKASYMKSLSEFYQSEVAGEKENAEHGERIARLRKCVEICEPISKVNTQYEKFYNQAKHQLDRAVKDNEMLYFLKEPAYQDLKEIEPKILAESIKVNYNSVMTTET